MPKWFNGNRYLPEPVRFAEMTDADAVRASRLTAGAVGQWATQYQAFPVTDQATRRYGPLPRRSSRRAAVVSEAFDWVVGVLSERGLPWQWVGLQLHRRNQLILDQHDGIPALLFLTRDQFPRLQEYWRQQELPEDLYFPAEDERVATVPLEMFGGVFLGPGRYSPLQWARRESAPPVSLAVPSEAERELALSAAGETFMSALALRRSDLTEPGREPDTNELAKVDALSRLVSSLLSDTINRQDRRRLEQGQPFTNPNENS